MDKIQQYAKDMNGRKIDYDGVWGHQCIDLIKNFTRHVYNIRLGTFGGSAKTGWINASNTFTDTLWERHTNDPSNKDQVPIPGDIIFFKGGQYGHVAIVLEAPKGVNKFTVIDQNTGDGNGFGDDDRIKIQDYTYKDVLGWFSLKSNKKEETPVDNKLEERVKTLENTLKKIKEAI